jgi:nitrate/nitrite transporter NarK
MGTMAVFVSLVGMITPALFGMIRDRTGTYTDAFLLFAALMALMLVLLSRVRYARPETIAAPTVTQAMA